MSAVYRGKMRFWGVLFFILVLAGGLRWYNLGEESLWSDEAYTAVFVEKHSLWEITSGQADDRVNPPFFYMVESVWTRAFGAGESALRWPAAVFGWLTVVAAAAAAFVLSRRRGVALGAAFLTAVSWYGVEYSQEARSYSLLVLLAVVQLAIVVVLFDWRRFEQPARRSWRVWLAHVGLAVVTAVGVYTHFAFWSLLAAEGVWLLWLLVGRSSRGKRTYLFSAMAALVVGAATFLYWFWVSTYPHLIRSKSSPFWQPALTWRSLSLFLQQALWIPAWVDWVLALVFVLVLLAAAFGVLFRYVRKQQRAIVVLLLCVLIIPFVFFWAFDLWLDRYVLFVVPVLFIVVTWAVVMLSRRVSVPLALVVFLAVSMSSAWWYRDYFREFQKEPWRQLMGFVQQYDDGKGRIFVNKEFSKFPWEYYYQGDTKTKFPKKVEGDVAEWEKEMAQYPWVMVVYMQTNDRGRLLEQGAAGVFASRETWRQGEIEALYFNGK